MLGAMKAGGTSGISSLLWWGSSLSAIAFIFQKRIYPPCDCTPRQSVGFCYATKKAFPNVSNHGLIGICVMLKVHINNCINFKRRKSYKREFSEHFSTSEFVYRMKKYGKRWSGRSLVIFGYSFINIKCLHVICFTPIESSEGCENMVLSSSELSDILVSKLRLNKLMIWFKFKKWRWKQHMYRLCYYKGAGFRSLFASDFDLGLT